MSRQNLAIKVNGELYAQEVECRRLLSDFLRDDLMLIGTKRGCETGTCGACTVLKDGVAIKSCLSLAVQCKGASITTIEGISQGDQLHPLQESFMNCGGLQCGYCTPGLIMSCVALLDKSTSPSEEQIRRSINGHLCRCTGYSQIVDSVMNAAEQMHGS
jgi:carbon-monoxide dehydrogenase small subunit